MSECSIHRKPSFGLATLVQKLGKLRRRSTGAQRGFLQDVVVEGKAVSNLWRTELTVLKIINTKCPLCLAEARELGDMVQQESDNAKLVAVVEDAPHLDAYLVGGLHSWSLVTDANAKISGHLALDHPTAHSTYIVAPGGIMLTSFEGNHAKSLTHLIKTLHLVP